MYNIFLSGKFDNNMHIFFSKMMNKTGHISKIHMGRVATLRMDNGQKAAFNVECITLVKPAPGREKSSWSDDSSDESSDDSDDGNIISDVNK